MKYDSSAKVRPDGAVAEYLEIWDPSRLPTGGVSLGFVVAALRDSPLAEPCGKPGGAAVLVPLYEEAGKAKVIFTRRSMELRTHTGEISFPGGGIDIGESAEEAALREAQEEISLDPKLVTPVGSLSSLDTVFNRVVTPVVGIIESGRPDLAPNAGEVHSILEFSVEELVAPGVYRRERWELPERGEREIHFFELDGQVIWGATGRILLDLIRRLAAYRGEH